MGVTLFSSFFFPITSLQRITYSFSQHNVEQDFEVVLVQVAVTHVCANWPLTFVGYWTVWWWRTSFLLWWTVFLTCRVKGGEKEVWNSNFFTACVVRRLRRQNLHYNGSHFAPFGHVCVNWSCPVCVALRRLWNHYFIFLLLHSLLPISPLLFFTVIACKIKSLPFSNHFDFMFRLLYNLWS